MFVFEYFRLKKEKLRLEYLLLSKLYNFVDGIPDITEIATKLKGLDSVALQKGIVEELVKFTKEKSE